MTKKSLIITILIPLDPGHSEEAWVKNRRAHTIITAK